MPTTRSSQPLKKTLSRGRSAKAKKVVTKKGANTAIRTAYTKAQLLTHLADTTGISKKEDVAAVLVALETVMHRHLRKGRVGEFTLPGLLKCVVNRKPATPGRNPFTGEMITFKAKPACRVVKIRALTKLNAMAA